MQQGLTMAASRGARAPVLWTGWCGPLESEQRPLFDEPGSKVPTPAGRDAESAFRYLLDDAQACEWTEDDVVQLHWRLLQELRDLTDPDTPLEVKFDTLRWVFTDPDKDAVPFSFANCLRVVGCSPLSPTAYFGAVDVGEVRQWIALWASCASCSARSSAGACRRICLAELRWCSARPGSRPWRHSWAARCLARCSISDLVTS